LKADLLAVSKAGSKDLKDASMAVMRVVRSAVHLAAMKGSRV